MPRPKTKPEDIKNPTHYFNRYIAMEVLHDQEATSDYYEVFSSLDEMIQHDSEAIGRKKLLQMAINENGELFEAEGECKNVDAWLSKINNKTLHAALLKLTYKQQYVLFLRYCCEESQYEVARILGIAQQNVSRLEHRAIKKLKKFCQGGVKSRD